MSKVSRINPHISVFACEELSPKLGQVYRVFMGTLHLTLTYKKNTHTETSHTCLLEHLNENKQQIQSWLIIVVNVIVIVITNRIRYLLFGQQAIDMENWQSVYKVAHQILIALTLAICRLQTNIHSSLC